MPVAVATGGQNHATSELGLGIDSVLLDALMNASLIPATRFGINAGSQSIAKPWDGSLVLGGFDQASINDHFTEYEMNYARICPLQVSMQRLTLRPEGREGIVLSDEGSSFHACIEPSVELLKYSMITANTIADTTTFSVFRRRFYNNSRP